MLKQEGEYPSTWMTASLRNESLDTFTTALSLNIAYHSSGNVIQTALAGYHWKGEGMSQPERLSVGRDLQPDALYARYWHGYLVILIPLLVLLNISQIRTVFLLTMTLLSASAIVLIGRRSSLASPIALSLVLANIWLAAVSTSLAFCYFVALAATVLVATRPADSPATLGESWGLFYFVVGAITVYVDFLDTPIVSLGLPLATQLILNADAVARTPWRRLAGIVLTCVVSWLAGYGLLWVSKWASLF